MSTPQDSDRPPGHPGSTTGTGGTAFAVDVARDKRARDEWVVFLAGPVIWFTHFMVVYLAVEAGCTGTGPGLSVFDPPVAEDLTVVATVVAAVACLAAAAWAARRWRAAQHRPAADDASELAGQVETWDRGGTLALAGLLLSLLSFTSVLFVGVPALWLSTC